MAVFGVCSIWNQPRGGRVLEDAWTVINYLQVIKLKEKSESDGYQLSGNPNGKEINACDAVPGWNPPHCTVSSNHSSGMWLSFQYKCLNETKNS